jgi:predicted PurR-regulated permease PerM
MPVRLRLTARSMALAVGLLGLTLLVLGMLAASARVIGWVLVAATLAGLLAPAVEILGRRLHRGVALAAVVVIMLALAGGVVYAVVQDVSDQLGQLRRAVPSAAREIERSERFGDAAKEVRFAQRAQTFVDELPERLRGGSVQQALRAAATRSVAFLATAVLTIFFLIHGRRLLQAGIRQLPQGRQAEVARVGAAAYRRWWAYLVGSLSMAVAAGVIAYAVAAALDLPGKAPLALWVSLIDVVPLVGIVLGAGPIILLASVTASWQGTAVAVVVLFAWQAIEALWLQHAVEARSLHIGPFVTVATALVGLELYGIGGALVGLDVVVLVAAVLDEAVAKRFDADGPGDEHPAVASGP